MRERTLCATGTVVSAGFHHTFALELRPGTDVSHPPLRGPVLLPHRTFDTRSSAAHFGAGGSMITRRRLPRRAISSRYSMHLCIRIPADLSILHQVSCGHLFSCAISMDEVVRPPTA